MQGWAGRTRPSDAAALTPYVARASRELGYLDPTAAPAVAYVMWAHWHTNDAPQVFRSLGQRMKGDALVAQGILPQTVLTHEAWAVMTAAGRKLGPVQAFSKTMQHAARLWLEDYKVRNPRWMYAFRRSEEPVQVSQRTDAGRELVADEGRGS
jgi:hypothetical protein